ncbi:major facilitator superfamily protein [Trichomonas vaginalis G3]|uniref:Major facilitator superfamily protein n=1 Tax=Trichomonas vaginalis (strain ATCC PRA-98 / G3) TaxID=412133 RepID=A2FAI6_TRIV3|nr:major facilitator superfamily transporter [Trichomonas vaginalis G3]EAX98079.1 major facilitator superfamily protein [Trichomonas vaginalis G3]KAI5515640.1 glucose import [Trichomonas vaginalis G3]|eukprot:XP_001311009.1 major facilitator superfamily transporter [Trichomonas vaginalis G3]
MLGSLNFGISVGIPTPLATLFESWNRTENELQWYNIITSLCAIFSPFFVTYVLNFLGRRIVFAILHIFAAGIYVLCLFMTKDKFWLAIFSRALVGLDIGGFTSLCPTMLIEIAPSKLGGFFGHLHQIGCVIGITIMYMQGTYAPWKTLFYTGIGFSALGTILICFCPETSPNRRKADPESLARKEKDTLFQEMYLEKLVIGLTMMFFQQFCGINAIISNLVQNFKDAGVPLETGIASTISMACQFLGVVINGFVVDKLGRRPLFCISSLGCAIMLFLFSMNTSYNLTNWVAIVIICFYLFFFGLALGPIPWFIVPELFPDTVRSMAASMVVVVNQFCSFIIVFMFPWMKNGMGQSATLIFYGVISALGAIFGFFYIIEPSNTKIGALDWDENDLEDDFVEIGQSLTKSVLI